MILDDIKYELLCYVDIVKLNHKIYSKIVGRYKKNIYICNNNQIKYSRMKKHYLIYLLFVCFTLSACMSNDVEDFTAESSSPNLTRAIIQPEFDWENADFMPTPAGMTPIPSPWMGQGSLVGTYDLDILNDRKKSEGWCLLYNSFSANPNVFLPNPFFILYNKYRGIMRVFYYVTDSFIQSSSNVLDNLSIMSLHSTKMFNFADAEIIDAKSRRSSLQHIQPKPSDGSMPVASHRWYMSQYELAYDPNIASIPYNQIAFNFNLNYMDISKIYLNGESISELKGTIGEQSEGELSKAFESTLEAGGKAVLSNVGYSLLKKEGAANDYFGLSANTYNTILKNIGNIASSSIGGVWKAALGLFNTMLFGTKTSPTPFYATINTKMTANGTFSQKGSFPTMPITFYMPGTNIPSNAIGWLPYYNKPLGVFNIDDKGLVIHVTRTKTQRIRHDDPFNPGEQIIESWENLTCGQLHDYSAYLQFNPEVEKIADINILKQEVFAMDNNGNIYHQTDFSAYNSGERGSVIERIPYVEFYLYFAIEVKPKDGSPSTIISKAFYLDNIVRNYENWLPEVN